jgi:succinylglutamate desuccinylase
VSEQLQSYLDRFEALRPDGGFAYRYAASFGEGAFSLHLVIGSMIHGDECGSLPGVLRVMEDLASGALRFGGRITFFVGNPEAGLRDVRFLEDDLNRVFLPDPPDNHEGRRARELKPILDAADVFLDLHQTILATEQPFYIAPFQVSGWHWARAVQGARVWVTRHPAQAFSAGTCCADEYVRLRGLPGLTLELSEKGFGHGGEQRAEAAVRRALALGQAVGSGESTLEAAVGSLDELVFLETVHREAFRSDALALRPGLINFREVVAGELLSAPGTPELRAPASGMVLFPKYPPVVDGAYKKPLPGEIYRIVCPLPAHPTVLYADALTPSVG